MTPEHALVPVPGGQGMSRLNPAAMASRTPPACSRGLAASPSPKRSPADIDAGALDQRRRQRQPRALRRVAREGDVPVAIDPRKLKAGELARLLNSTLGEVISERQLHRHRTRGVPRRGRRRRGQSRSVPARRVAGDHRGTRRSRMLPRPEGG